MFNLNADHLLDEERMSNGSDVKTDRGEEAEVISQPEEAIQNCINDDILGDEVMQLTFETEEQAYDFYNMYVNITEFSVRIVDVKAFTDKSMQYRKLVCSRQGRRIISTTNASAERGEKDLKQG